MALTLIEIWLILSVLFAMGYVVVMIQTFFLGRLLRVGAWYGVTGGFGIVAGSLVWNVIRLPVNLMAARDRGYQIPTHLTTIQKVQIGIGFLAILLFIFSFDWMRRRFKSRFDV